MCRAFQTLVAIRRIKTQGRTNGLGCLPAFSFTRWRSVPVEISRFRSSWRVCIIGKRPRFELSRPECLLKRLFSHKMANSKYEYVKTFEVEDKLLPHTWIVVRIDGRSFHRFAEVHEFEKPNDINALNLMNECARSVMEDLPHIVFAYGVSDEYSFIIRKDSNLYKRRASKLVSIIASLFAATYVFKWPTFFLDKKLQYPPAFDGRAVCYPNDFVLRDYLSWRQVDCHINNQYNTCLWNMVKAGKTKDSANNELQGTRADFKNEMLFKEFGINYNDLPQIFRKGSYIYRNKQIEDIDAPSKKLKYVLTVEHGDIISDVFWKENPYILEV